MNIIAWAAALPSANNPYALAAFALLLLVFVAQSRR
jgi:hypothetical protein